MTPESWSGRLLGGASLSAYLWQRVFADEFTQRGIDHCWAAVSVNTHSHGNG
jgi:hypothetical protein